MDLTKWTVLSLLDIKFLRNLKLAVIFGRTFCYNRYMQVCFMI